MKKSIIGLFVLCFMLQPAALFSKAAEDYSIAYINDYEGECDLRRKNEREVRAVYDIFTPLYAGDTVMTGFSSSAEIVFDDETIIKLGPNSKMTVRNIDRKGTSKTVLDLLKGSIMAVVKKLNEKEEFSVRTKMAMAAVKGTEFIIETGENEKVGVFEGAVSVSAFDMDGNPRNTVILLKDRETTIVKTMRKPGKPVRLSGNFVKRYKEVGDIREKLKMVREMRREGRAKEYRLERRLKRVENLKMIKNSDPAKFRSLPSEQRQLINEMIKMEQFYRQSLEKERKSKRNKRIMKNTGSSKDIGAETGRD